MQRLCNIFSQLLQLFLQLEFQILLMATKQEKLGFLLYKFLKPFRQEQIYVEKFLR